MGSDEKGDKRQERVSQATIRAGAVAAALVILVTALSYATFNVQGEGKVADVLGSSALPIIPSPPPLRSSSGRPPQAASGVGGSSPQQKVASSSPGKGSKKAGMVAGKGGGGVAVTGWPSQTDAALAERQLRAYRRYALTGFRNKATTDFKILHAFLQSHKGQVKGDQPCATFDVGANLGKYSVDLMELPVVRGCTIWAFEPNPIVHKQLLKTVARYRNIKPLNVGVGAKVANLTFYYRPGDTHDTGGSFNEDNSRGGAGRTTREKSTALVRVITLDELIAAEVPREWSIPLVKIDVEGLEKDVKLGMVETLRAGRVSAVYWERQGAYELEPFREEVGFMARHGYAVYIIGSVPFAAGGEWHKHNSRAVLVRVDGGYFREHFSPHLYKGPGRNGPQTGKPIAINLLAVQAAHPFNALVRSRFTIRH